MKYIIVFLGLIFVLSCKNENKDSQDNSFSDNQMNEVKQAALYFDELKIALEQDQGAFWSEKLYGPILLIDPENRIFYANENNNKGSFVKTGNVFTDTLSVEMSIANTAFDWDGKRWTMLMLPLPENKAARLNLFIHELFHGLQPKIGFNNLNEQINAHLDKKKYRVYLKLELEALKKAVSDKENRITHIRNALVFRLLRYDDQEHKKNENAVEINEGIAEYTGVMLSGRSNNEMTAHFIESINGFYTNPTFVRSFAYQTIPVYGYLLAMQNKMWHQSVSQTTNLTDLFVNEFNMEISDEMEEKSLIFRNKYGYEKIVEQENIREKEKLVVIEEYKTLFIIKPILKLEFENMNIAFDPRNIMPLEDYGTIYPDIRVTDNWGILTVKEGALLSNDWTNIVVSEPVEISENLVKGKGWTLELNESWQVEKGNETYTLKKGN